MKFVIIYGPPAVGKLTVARALAKQTGFRVFHNHLTLDAVHEAAPFGSPQFWAVVHEFRERIVSLAAKEKVKGLIYTGCYNFRSDDRVMRRMIRAAERYGAKAFLVHLTADKAAIEQRVRQASRKMHKKVASVRSLRQAFRKYEFYKPYPARPSLQLDNTRLGPVAVARRIKKHYRL